MTTAVLSATLLLSAWSYLFHATTIAAVRALALPDYLRIELAVLKIVAAAVLLAPQIPSAAKEWAYAGAAIFFVTSIVAHAVHGDPYWMHLVNFALLALLVTSNVYLPR
ncbi:MAG: DoxX family protein [Jannaschia sp.]